MQLNASIARMIDRIGRVPRAYRSVFETDAGAIVLRDLAKFAGALETSVEAGDPQMTAFQEGRRAVFLHIAEKLRWNERDLLKLAEASAAAAAENAGEMPE